MLFWTDVCSNIIFKYLITDNTNPSSFILVCFEQDLFERSKHHRSLFSLNPSITIKSLDPVIYVIKICLYYHTDSTLATLALFLFCITSFPGHPNWPAEDMCASFRLCVCPVISYTLTGMKLNSPFVKQDDFGLHVSHIFISLESLKRVIEKLSFYTRLKITFWSCKCIFILNLQ